MNAHFQRVDLKKAYRLLNHGPTVLVSAGHEGVDDVMAAAWACALDFDPPKLTVVLDKSTFTRGLVEASGWLAIQVPTAAQAQLVHRLGTRSLGSEPDKLASSGVVIERVDAYAPPLVQGCAAWLMCRVIAEPHNQQAYDLFIAEVVEAWADDRVFSDGHWQYERAPESLRSLHYVAGGHFYAIGEAVVVPVDA
ncbi:flavin reductase family protein [Pseudomonas sp. S75]|uniref:flavin reductase family protein n=1 Tax=unclassified Pseudomonas TaxID=196821 RepID=UPI0019039348|nr:MULTISPECIES: flavin reductase family protein [unclassified Pseudomonas]MBJ9973892.1 flavin reductase family protein [Pseudomonas sp. S30]MBK0152178.1 flavin reductase family protein [Pseudomonas sp. S75]